MFGKEKRGRHRRKTPGGVLGRGQNGIKDGLGMVLGGLFVSEGRKRGSFLKEGKTSRQGQQETYT